MSGTLPGEGATRPANDGPVHGWPANELEETLQASVGVPDAGPRLVQVLSRSSLWIPLPEGGGPDSPSLDLPTVEIEGAAYVPVFSSLAEFQLGAGTHLSFAVAPGRDFARGLPPQAGIVVNPGGTVGAPVPPPAVAEMCRAAPGEREGRPSGARMRLFAPDWQQEPVDFLAVAGRELAALGYVRTARRGLTAADGAPPALCVGVEADPGQVSPETQTEIQEALGRALAAVQVRWPVQLVLMDVADDPVIDWLRTCVTPFYRREDTVPAAAGAPRVPEGAPAGHDAWEVAAGHQAGTGASPYEVPAAHQQETGASPYEVPAVHQQETGASPYEVPAAHQQETGASPYEVPAGHQAGTGASPYGPPQHGYPAQPG